MECPKCGKHYDGNSALSREDNKTNVCPRCGLREAIESEGYAEEEIDKALKVFDKGAGKDCRSSKE